MREQLSGPLYASNPVPVPPVNASGPPRTLFGRLGIRKPSLLSLTSPLVPPAHTARTFSLDDLLKPPSRSKKHPVPVFTVLEPGLVNVHDPHTSLFVHSTCDFGFLFSGALSQSWLEWSRFLSIHLLTLSFSISLKMVLVHDYLLLFSCFQNHKLRKYICINKIIKQNYQNTEIGIKYISSFSSQNEGVRCLMLNHNR